MIEPDGYRFKLAGFEEYIIDPFQFFLLIPDVLAIRLNSTETVALNLAIISRSAKRV
jgi:hypothetical protein